MNNIAIQQLKIITTNNPAEMELLRTPSKKVASAQLQSTEFQTLLENLFATLKQGTKDKKYVGVGLSAVQVGELINVFISYDSNRDTLFEYINPKVTLMGEATDTRPEVCLSIPGILGEVERHKKVKVEWVDREGKKHTKKFTGFNARIIQHEYDHLQGILFIAKAVGKAKSI